MSADDDKNPQIEDEGQDDDQEEDEQPTVAPPSGDHKTLEEDEDVLCQMYGDRANRSSILGGFWLFLAESLFFLK